MRTMNDMLIDASTLHSLLAGPNPPLIFDCRFELANPAAGQAQYESGHLPGAQYLHLDEVLSGPKVDANGVFRGRHPLPDRGVFAKALAQRGWQPGRAVVAYDASGGIFAVRLWWLLRWLGETEIVLLDGGLPAWTAAGLPLSTAAPTPLARELPAALPAPALPTMAADELLRRLGQLSLIDARAAERFRGEVEPLDTQAGHIPGALNRPFALNLQPDGRFKPAEQLRAEWQALLGQPSLVVHHCGSGVTGCHNLFAVALAGLGLGTLYPGSWSEWSSDPSRPVARA